MVKEKGKFFAIVDGMQNLCTSLDSGSDCRIVFAGLVDVLGSKAVVRSETVHHADEDEYARRHANLHKVSGSVGLRRIYYIEWTFNLENLEVMVNEKHKSLTVLMDRGMVELMGCSADAILGAAIQRKQISDASGIKNSTEGSTSSCRVLENAMRRAMSTTIATWMREKTI